MAQGKQKFKAQKSGGSKKPQNKPRGDLDVAIRNKIEEEITQKASSSLHKKLSVLKAPQGKGGGGASKPGASAAGPSK
uniref:Uncharacterized protein n=1 Tax=Astyanax mexicanus TaxID=7994 RepID=A0A3B1IZG7_ASTMX